MVRRAVFVITLLTVALSVHAQVTIQTGNTLSELISNLYGGNGIQLKPNGHAAHFGDTQDFQEFSAVLQKTLQARPVFPLPSSVGLVSYRFNEETGTYDRVETSFGPILAERATTSGRGHSNFAVSYTASDFQLFDGNESVALTLRHCLTDACFGNSGQPFLRDVINVDVRMKLKSQVVATSVIYGLTDRIDVGIILPYVRNDLNVFTNGVVIPDPGTAPGVHQFDPTVGDTPGQMAVGHAIGIGDIVLRGKMQLPLKLPLQTAVLGDVTLPTGDKEDFLGTGDLRVKTTFIASHTGKRFAPHLNVGYELNTKNSKLSTFDVRLGSEVVITPRMTLAGDIVSTLHPSTADEFRVDALNGETLIPRSEIDGALGVKWRLGPRSLLVVNLLRPMNNSGIRPENVFTFGMQAGL